MSAVKETNWPKILGFGIGLCTLIALVTGYILGYFYLYVPQAVIQQKIVESDTKMAKIEAKINELDLNLDNTIWDSYKEQTKLGGSIDRITSELEELRFLEKSLYNIEGQLKYIQAGVQDFKNRVEEDIKEIKDIKYNVEAEVRGCRNKVEAEVRALRNMVEAQVRGFTNSVQVKLKYIESEVKDLKDRIDIITKQIGTPANEGK